ncbi:hypothetical protein C5S35_17260 [Candidatus Methanophagaceae archaeon]|nr:hypothetical protein C5S35_17260 [Methanophagales archaeon]
MNKKIFTIGYEIPGRSEDLLDFTSNKSLMDADIVLFNTDTPNGLDYIYPTFQGKNSYTEDASFDYKEQLKHWRNELDNFLKTGKIVFLLLSTKEEFYLKTGEKQHSGTGRNRQTTNIVNLHNNYEFLPVNIGRITAATGKHIEFTGNIIFNDFFKRFKKNLEYQVYLENVENAQVIFTGKDKTKTLGAVYKIGDGHLVVLPYVKNDEENFTRYDKKEDKSYWTEDAIKFGNNFIDCLLSINQQLAQESKKTPLPKWATLKQFSTKKELETKKAIDKNTKGIEEIKLRNEKLQVELEEEQALKDLLFEQGKPLENAVIESLKILGYKAENYDDGELELDQVITSPEGHRFIGECEGKDNKDINITKFRQLLESLNADFAREEVEEKAFGILFGNPERLKNPAERTLDFTKKCKIGAEREKILLIKTTDLFVVTKYLKENNDTAYQKACRKAIYDGLGKIVRFPSIHKKK